MADDCQFPEQCGFPDCICTGMIFDFDEDLEERTDLTFEEVADGTQEGTEYPFTIERDDDLEPFGEDVGKEKEVMNYDEA